MTQRTSSPSPSLAHLAAALLLPAGLAALLAGVAMLVDELRARSPIARMLFNVGTTTCNTRLERAGLLRGFRRTDENDRAAGFMFPPPGLRPRIPCMLGPRFIEFTQANRVSERA